MKKALTYGEKTISFLLFLSLAAEIVLLISRLIGNETGKYPLVFGILSVSFGVILYIVLLLGKKAGNVTAKLVLFRAAFAAVGFAGDFLSGKFTQGSVPFMLMKAVFYAGETVFFALALALICVFVACAAEKE